MTFIAVGVLILLGLALYFAFAPGPRRWRAFHRARKLLDSGDWRATLDLVNSLNPAGQPTAWQVRLNNLGGECHQLALDAALKDRQFEDALMHADQAATLLSLDAEELRSRVTEGVMTEIRRLFSAGAGQTEALMEMVSRTRQLFGAIPPEACFWYALSEARQGHFEQAVTLLITIQDEAGKSILDIPLYLGILHHRLGKPQEALRFLADANRIDANCPFVPWQMGISMVAAEKDNDLAIRALQRALSNRGLLLWQKQPDRMWVDAFPEARSYVRRLAARFKFVCPLLGADYNVLLRQGQLALAQAFYRQQRYQEAADLYARLLQDSPPTLILVRGYGLSLAQLGQHDQAYKHLRIALDQEDPKDPFTAAYLALCGAMGKPTNPQDKPRNVAWALKLLARFPVLGNVEWANILLTVHGEARRLGGASIPGREEQTLLCDALASVLAHDATAAQAYAQFGADFPDAIKPIHTWLYARATTEHQVSVANDLDLLARAVSTTYLPGEEGDRVRRFYEKQGWDFGEVEYTYLERFSLQGKTPPGRFPEALGTNYPAHGEAFLLKRSTFQEQKGQLDQARKCMEVLLALAPNCMPAFDRLACLSYRVGNLPRSIEILQQWHLLAPRDHWPLVRQAIILQQTARPENSERVPQLFDQALSLTTGSLRAGIAYLGARLCLRDAILQSKSNTEMDPATAHQAQRFLKECLSAQPDHPDALWVLAALYTVMGDREGVKSLSPALNNREVKNSRYQFMGAVCHLAARKYSQVIDQSEQAAALEPELETESRYVQAWARIHQGDDEVARHLLRKAAIAEKEQSPSSPYARALLGAIAYQQAKLDEAIRWWSSVDPALRSQWGLDEPLRQTLLLRGLDNLGERRYEQAAERFVEAGKAGYREKGRLSGLITMALVKAAQQLLFAETDTIRG